MASGLSDDEFQRMQTQLLELRTTNYQLDDQTKRQERELVDLRSKVEILDRDLQKANKIITKSKKAKEYEQLCLENEGLQRQLHSQEEEYRLQNQTLMTELATLVAANEQLENDVKAVKSGSIQVDTEGDDSGINDQCRRLQAKNAALEKNYQEKQDQYDSDVSHLRQTIVDLENQCVKLSGKRTGPLGQADSESERSVEGESAVESHQEIQEYVKQKELRLCLDTEKEENRMLKEQLSTAENSHREKSNCLQQELDKMSEKFKKKQESLVHLQEEKEQQYTSLMKKNQELEELKDKEMSLLKDQCMRLHEELGATNKNLETLKQKSGHQINELEEILTDLRAQLSSANIEANDQLQSDYRLLEAKAYQHEQDLNNCHAQIQTLQNTIQSNERLHRDLQSQIQILTTECEKQRDLLTECNKVADKRKALLDELAIKYQTESDNHRETTKTNEKNHLEETESLNSQISQLQSEVSHMVKLRDELRSVNSELQNTEEAKGWLERRLNETQDSLNETRADLESKLDTTHNEHDEQITQLKDEHASIIEEKERLLTENEAIVEGKDENIAKLEQQIKDSVEERRIHEKKGLTIVKDLKRQLQSERRTVEKLQKKLQEVLSDTKHRQSMEELLADTDSIKQDTGSVSSYGTSIISKDNQPAPTSPDTTDSISVSQHSGLSNLLEHENNDLLDRLAQLKDQNWMLEEKVSHLESSNACYADDILRKTAIIEHYVVDGRTDAQKDHQQDNFSLRRVVDFVKDRGDESLKDINRKLQRMVEETLTKNMHLQQDMETLSQEVVRLSKLQGLGTPTELINKTIEADITSKTNTPAET